MKCNWQVATVEMFYCKLHATIRSLPLPFLGITQFWLNQWTMLNVQILHSIVTDSFLMRNWSVFVVVVVVVVVSTQSTSCPVAHMRLMASKSLTLCDHRQIHRCVQFRIGRFDFMYDLHVSCHIVFARELFETIRTRIDFHRSLMRCDKVTAEITDVGIYAWACLASIRVITFFGTEIPDRAFWIVDNVFARSIAGHLRFDFHRFRCAIVERCAARRRATRIAGIRCIRCIRRTVIHAQCRCGKIIVKYVNEIVVV